MQPRNLTSSDFAAVADIHRRLGFDYKFPDLGNPLFIVKHGIYDEQGRLLGAGALRVQTEAYLWLDPALSNVVRFKLICALSRSLAVDAWRAGLDCAVAYLPPALPPAFLKLLARLGWSKARDGWQAWSKDI
jgi:hypothetical protein